MYTDNIELLFELSVDRELSIKIAESNLDLVTKARVLIELARSGQAINDVRRFKERMVIKAGDVRKKSRELGHNDQWTVEAIVCESVIEDIDRILSNFREDLI